MLAPYQNPAMVSHPTPSPQEVDTGLVCLLILARSRHDLEAAWNGTLMLLTTRSRLRSTARKFDVTWFLPAIFTSQQRWLHTRRNPCKSHICTKKSYEDRIKDLQRTLSPHIISSVQLITPEKAHAICNEVLKLTNTAQLAQRLMQFSPAPEEEDAKWRKLPGTEATFVSDILDVDYNRDGKKDRLAIIGGGGTCGNSDIVDLAAAIKRGDASGMGYLGFSDEEVESDEDLRWADWGRGDHFLFVQDEPVVVTANFGQKSADVRLVSWFGEGQKRPLCMFAPAGQVQIRVVADSHPRLCKVVAGGRWQPIAWHGPVSPDDIPMLTVAGHHADGGSTALIDINTDGQPDNLALLDYASGAGCGSYRQWLVAFSEDGKTVPPSGLNRALHNVGGPMTRYREPKQWHDIQIFTFEGKPSILGSSPKYVVGVYSVWKDVLQTWCGFEVLEQFKIERVFTPR